MDNYLRIRLWCGANKCSSNSACWLLSYDVGSGQKWLQEQQGAVNESWTLLGVSHLVCLSFLNANVTLAIRFYSEWEATVILFFSQSFYAYIINIDLYSIVAFPLA